jgi:hypothetical protein
MEVPNVRYTHALPVTPIATAVSNGMGRLAPRAACAPSAQVLSRRVGQVRIIFPDGAPEANVSTLRQTREGVPRNKYGWNKIAPFPITPSRLARIRCDCNSLICILDHERHASTGHAYDLASLAPCRRRRNIAPQAAIARRPDTAGSGTLCAPGPPLASPGCG